MESPSRQGSRLLVLWVLSVGLCPKKRLLARPRIESEVASCCWSRWLGCHELDMPGTLCHLGRPSLESLCH